MDGETLAKLEKKSEKHSNSEFVVSLLLVLAFVMLSGYLVLQLQDADRPTAGLQYCNRDCN